MFKNRVKENYASPTKQTLGFCENCGSHKISTFAEAEFVLVKMKNRTPFYGRIMDTFSDEDGASAIIEKGLGDKEPVNIKYIYKLGEEWLT